jgi:uncharacterized membrane protein (UPF0127 family)
MRRLSLPALALWMAFSLLGCASAGQPWVELKGQRFIVEVADTQEARNKGLMFRDSLGEDRGMLFIFDQQQPLAMWMKNTRIPLDILYFDQYRRLVSVSAGAPPCSLGDRCPPFRSTAPALYTLELNAGQASRLGVQPGDELVFGPGIPERGAP